MHVSWSETYRLYDETEVSRDLEHRGNQCLDVPSAQREGV